LTRTFSAQRFPSKPGVCSSIVERLQITKRRFFFALHLHLKTSSLAPAAGAIRPESGLKRVEAGARSAILFIATYARTIWASGIKDRKIQFFDVSCLT
jgi:hypothetical protein